MKTKRILALLILSLLCLCLLTGCGNYIGKKAAKAIALGDAGVSVKDIRDYDCELEREVVGKTAYEISFDIGYDEYEYVIDALTGEILKSKID